MRMTTKYLIANTSLALFFAPVFMSSVQPNDSMLYFLANQEARDCIPWVRKNPLHKEMATCSSILAWRIPWTEEPGGLQCVGLQESNTTYWLNHYTNIIILSGRKKYACL